MAINTKEMFWPPHSYTTTQTQDNRKGSWWAQRNNPEASSAEPFWWIFTKRLIDASLKSLLFFPSDTFGTVDVFPFNHYVGVGLLQSKPESTRTQQGTSLCVHFLFLSRMQRAAGLDRGWGKWAECFWVLSPCGVVVDRDGSCSERGQRGGNAGSHHPTRGWQLLGLHRYRYCRFLVIHHTSLRTSISLEKLVLNGEMKHFY